ncbi:hypothetical protein ACHAXS_010700, partial [Conticribra weissflogii]
GERTLRCCFGSWRGLVRFQQRRHWNAFTQLLGCNVHVSGQMPGLHNHDDWAVVQQCLSAVHLEAGGAIQPQRCAQNACTQNIQSHSPNNLTP